MLDVKKVGNHYAVSRLFFSVLSFNITIIDCLQQFRNSHIILHLGQSVSQDVTIKITVCTQRGHRKAELFHKVLNITFLVCNLRHNGIVVL